MGLNLHRIKDIVALLLALAALAERAAGRGLLARWFVCWIAGRAERVALSMIAEPDEIEALTARSSGSGPADLLCRAASLRTVARLLADTYLASSGGDRKRVERACMCPAGCAPATRAAVAAPCDTS